jgi:chemotaxis protein histidine kinase CheA
VLTARERDLGAELENTRKEHRTVLANIREQHGQALADAKTKHAAALQAEQTLYRQQLKEKEAKIEALASQLKQTLVHVKSSEETQRKARGELKAALAQAEEQRTEEAQHAAEAEQRAAQAEAAATAAQAARDAALEEMASLRAKVEANDDEVAKLEAHLSETVTHIGTMKGRMEDLEESLEVVLVRLQVAVDKGAVPPIRPSEIKALGIGATPSGQVRISIPHVRTCQSPSGGMYHTYCVFVTVGHEQWTVDRRYSELLAFHQEIRRQLPGADAIPFPPKVTLGSRSSRLAEDRREKLQSYLQAVVALAVSLVGTPVQQDPCKENLLLTLPFLGEDADSLSPMPDFDEDYAVITGSGRESRASPGRA